MDQKREVSDIVFVSRDGAGTSLVLEFDYSVASKGEQAVFLGIRKDTWFKNDSLVS